MWVRLIARLCLLGSICSTNKEQTCTWMDGQSVLAPNSKQIDYKFIPIKHIQLALYGYSHKYFQLMPDIFCIVNNSSRTKSRKRSNHLVHMRNFASLCIHLPDMFTLNAVDICILTFLYFLDSIDVGIIVDIIIIMNTRKKVESSN